jgi:hypothetical protein
MNCIRIKRIIDEADRPDVFPLEAAGHLAGCPDCQTFADERAKLRELTGSVGRVTAPSNFNALLNERLSRVRSQKSSWLSPVGFLRVASATAGLLVVFVALQYGGFLSTKGPAADQQTARLAEGSQGGGLNDVVQPAAPTAVTVNPNDQGAGPMVTGTVRTVSRTNTVAPSRAQRPARQDGPPLLLVRDSNGDRTMPMIPVSVGMQQVLNASLGRQQPRSSDISY